MCLDRRGAENFLPARFAFSVRVVIRVETRVVVAVQEQIERERSVRVECVDVVAQQKQ